jgi:GNAT superfamily N-acetyltransferase
MIRAASVDDARGIATVHVRGWQTSYRGLLPDDHLDHLSVDRRTETWAKWLADPQQPTAVYIAADVVGFVNLGASRDADAGPQTGEVMAIYVLADLHRRGIGTALLSWAVAEAAVHGWRQMTLWTLAANAGARAFYERCGWVLDGASKREPFAGAIVDQVRFRR